MDGSCLTDCSTRRHHQAVSGDGRRSDSSVGGVIGNYGALDSTDGAWLTIGNSHLEHRKSLDTTMTAESLSTTWEDPCGHMPVFIGRDHLSDGVDFGEMNSASLLSENRRVVQTNTTLRRSTCNVD